MQIEITDRLSRLATQQEIGISDKQINDRLLGALLRRAEDSFGY